MAHLHAGASRSTPRLLVVPGLHDSGPAHWQSWLQAVVRSSVRVTQHDWSTPDLDRWSDAIATTVRSKADGRAWIAVAHSFGCLALAQHLSRADHRIAAALLVAPADPERFGIAPERLAHALPVSATVVSSDTDPWMSAARARDWAGRWGAHLVSLGEAGHINAEAGFGPLPLARRWVDARAARLARDHRLAHAEPLEWSFAT